MIFVTNALLLIALEYARVNLFLNRDLRNLVGERAGPLIKTVDLRKSFDYLHLHIVDRQNNKGSKP